MLDLLPYSLLIPLAMALALAPLSPMPHLVEKLIMLKEGTLVKPIDIFDLAMHATPLLLLIAKGAKDWLFASPGA
ncbi:MAG: hypothetical protein HQK87_07080 [Nitrospinae bacterium]|nr:hypothetical protein [Nitrospinota bacterium]